MARAGGLAVVVGALAVVLGALVVGAAERLVVAVGDGDVDGDRDAPDEAFVAVPASFPPAALPMMTRRRKTDPIQLTTCTHVGSDRKRLHQLRP